MGHAGHRGIKRSSICRQSWDGLDGRGLLLGMTLRHAVDSNSAQTRPFSSGRRHTGQLLPCLAFVVRRMWWLRSGSFGTAVGDRWGPPTTPRSSRMNELATKIISKGARRACADDRSEVWQTRKGSAGKFRFEQGTVLRNWDGAATACYDIMALSRDLPGQPAAL
jgi:hypothetical protein